MPPAHLASAPAGVWHICFPLFDMFRVQKGHWGRFFLKTNLLLLVSLLKWHGLATDVFSVIQWKKFFLFLKKKKRTYFSGFATACYGLGMVFIHNSFGNNTYNIRQQSCLQLFKRNLTPLLRQYISGQRKFSWLLRSLKNRPHNCGV